MRTTPLSPVNGKFFNCNAELSAIVGPIGSGKSTAACLRLCRHSYEQRPSHDGIARTRFAIVRNTKPQLRDTTMKTWFQVFPEALYGRREITDFQHTWRFRPQGHEHEIHAEFMFRPLDTEKDVAELLSLEVTGFYFNELREINDSILAMARKRAGRFPPAELGGCTWKGWFGDSNPWHDRHPLHQLFVDERTRDRDSRLFRQPSGLAPDAENLENLNQTPETSDLPFGDPRRREQGRTYYTKHNFNADDAKVYIEAEWGHTRAGKPIYTEYRDRIHCQPFELEPRRPLEIGLDFGRTPAAVIGQETTIGGWRIRWELCATDMGLVEFAERLGKFLERYAPGFTVARVTGDPAGMAKDSHDHTAFDILKGAGLVNARAARTNELSVRIEAVQGALRRLVGGEPGLVIHPDCAVLRTAMIDGYHYRKLAIVGEAYAEDPQKNEYSHPAEALQYFLLGGGEASTVFGRDRVRGAQHRPKYTLTD
jgi:hypothetical protein